MQNHEGINHKTEDICVVLRTAGRFTGSVQAGSHRAVNCCPALWGLSHSLSLISHSSSETPEQCLFLSEYKMFSAQHTDHHFKTSCHFTALLEHIKQELN